MELILLIAIAILVTVLLVLALTKGNNQTQAEQLQIALRQQMQENREELNRSIRELRMDADAQPEYAATSRRSAQKHDDYRRTATAKVRHDGPPAGSITEIHRETTG